MPNRDGSKPGRRRDRDGKGRFVRGNNANPKGRPPGRRNRTTMAAQALLDGEAERLTRRAVELALGGNIAALRLCVERLMPPAKSGPVVLDLPAMKTTADLVAASAALVKAVGDGEVNAADAEPVARLLELHRRALEVENLERRLDDLEARLTERGR